LKRLKFACHINPSKAEISALEPDTDVSFLPMECIGTDGTTDLSRTKRLHEVRQGFTYFRDGDVIVAKITPCFENGKGALCSNLVNGTGFGTTELHVLRPLPEINPRFVFYATISEPFRVFGTTTMYGAAGQQRVSEQFISDFPLALPTADEQRLVAAFLDHETTKIDALIAKKERLIELLQEKRAALISHAVTKGLDSKVPMKDSGVEWLGNIPEHWEMKRLKFLAQVHSGVAKGRDLGDKVTTELPYLRVANVQNGFLDLSDVATIVVGQDEVDRFSLQRGDVLMTEGGDYDKLAL
jgi:type I restriction enzyme S subunit